MTIASTITEIDFRYVADFVRREAAIVLESGKEYLVEARLASVARLEGFDGLASLVDSMRKRQHPVLAKKVIEALTTNETSFFRDSEPFDAMISILLPEMIQKRQYQRAITIWSAAASTGQEAYSLCMLIKEHFPLLHDWKINIIGTDINQSVLAKASEGIFTQFEINRGLPARYLVKYFERYGTEWRIKEEIRKMVSFTEVNLIKPLPVLPQFDFIFLRNVLIYFDMQTKKDILTRIKNNLHPDGYLFLGAAETTMHIDNSFERRPVCKTSCYLRSSKQQ